MAYDHVDLNEILLEGTDYEGGSNFEADDGSDEASFGDLEGPDGSMEEFSFEGAQDAVSPPEQEAYAYEFMGLSSEAEMDEFLGKLMSGVSKRLRQAAKRVVPHAVRMLRGPARQLLAKALPLVGTAAGSVVPGLGTVLGGAAGSALGRMLAGEAAGDGGDQLGELVMQGEYGTLDEAKMDVAQRVVRTVSQAAAAAATDPRATTNPVGAARDALSRAVQQHLPVGVRRALAGGAGSGASGRWIRRGNRIVILGV